LAERLVEVGVEGEVVGAILGHATGPSPRLITPGDVDGDGSGARRLQYGSPQLALF